MAPRRNALPAPGGLFESTGNRARQLASGNPGTGNFNDRTATDFAAGIAGLSAVIEGIQLQRDSVKAVELETKATVDMQAEMAKLNPLDKDYQTQVKTVTDEAKRRVMEGGITSTAVADDLAKRMDRHGAAMQIAAVGETKSAVNKQAQLSYGDAADAASAKILRDPANANLYADELRADVERLKVGMDPIAFETLSRKAADGLTKAQIQGYAEKGNFAAARSTLKAQAEHLGSNTTIAMSQFIDGRESKARADGDRARTANAADVLLRIEDQFNGRAPIDPSMREKLDDMKAKGMISPEQHLQAVKTWNNENQRYQVAAQKTAVAMEQFSTGTLSSQENANLAFVAQFGNVPFGRIAQSGTPEQKAAGIMIATTMATSSGGFLPDGMKNMISNADRMSDPKQAPAVAYAAEAMDALEAKAANKIAGVTLSDTGVVNRTRAEAKRLIADGVPPAEARLLAAQTQMSKDAPTLQVENDLKEVAKTDLKKMDPAAQALSAVSDWTERNIPFMAPEASATMGAEYRRIYEQAYVDTRGDKDRAKTLADTRMKKDYGVTQVGVADARLSTPGEAPAVDPFGLTPGYTDAGSTTPGMQGQGRAMVQKHPPERYMKQFFPQLSDNQLAKIIMAELDTFNAREKIAPAPSKDTPGRSPVYLMPDATTEADLRSGRPPSYEYRVLRGDLYEPIVSATTGKPVRYTIPSSVGQVKDNPVYREIEKARIDETRRKIDHDIEIQRIVPDDAADERVKRMREEGRKLKGNH